MRALLVLALLSTACARVITEDDPGPIGCGSDADCPAWVPRCAGHVFELARSCDCDVTTGCEPSCRCDVDCRVCVEAELCPGDCAGASCEVTRCDPERGCVVDAPCP